MKKQALSDLTSKEFKDELSELVGALRKDIEAHQLGLDASPEAIAARRKRVLSGDFEFFAYTYFPHHIRGIPSMFQAQFCARFPQLLAQPGVDADELHGGDATLRRQQPPLCSR